MRENFLRKMLNLNWAKNKHFFFYRLLLDDTTTHTGVDSNEIRLINNIFILKEELVLAGNFLLPLSRFARSITTFTSETVA